MVILVFFCVSVARAEDGTKDRWIRAYHEAQELKSTLSIKREIYLDALKTMKATAEKYGLNFDRLTEDLEAELSDELPETKKDEIPTESRYILFISSSMDPETIRNYATDLRGRVLFLLRGFVGVTPGDPVRIMPTIMWWARIFRDEILKKKETVPLGIDPQAFEKASVDLVPALYDPRKNCVVFGDVSAERLIAAIEAGECGKVFGTTHEVIEADGVAQIVSYIRSLEINSEKFVSALKEKLIHRLEDYECVNLPTGDKTRSYTVRPMYELTFDIHDPNTGRVLYPRGFRFNPLEYTSPAGSILVVDGRDELELKALPGLIEESPAPVRIFLIAGNAISVGKIINKAPVYPFCRAVKKLMAYGACGSVPCRVIFDPPYLRVTEIGRNDLLKYIAQKKEQGGGK